MEGPWGTWGTWGANKREGPRALLLGGFRPYVAATFAQPQRLPSASLGQRGREGWIVPSIPCEDSGVAQSCGRMLCSMINGPLSL
jgi:hypothetical protein